MPAPGFSAPVGNTIRRRDGVSCDGWDCLASGTQFGIVLVFLAVVSVVLYIYYRLIVKPHKNRHDVEMALGRGNTTATRSATAISLELPPPAYQEHVAFRYPQPLIRRRTGLPGRRMTAGFGFNHGNYELQTLEPRHREVRYQATTYLQPPPAVVFWTDPWTAMPPPPPYRPPIVIVPGPPQKEVLLWDRRHCSLVLKHKRKRKRQLLVQAALLVLPLNTSLKRTDSPWQASPRPHLITPIDQRVIIEPDDGSSA
ncbi:hypothetical protein B0H63DRAFT_564925 [Podospora didyma]|uniref:Uncharacterized protein n=1 Tax=Podospora didyma TaxID=330526 RepID=A0AAE0K1F0_9PEZI|nr:hypothetical protein B0H63DRAFT_564925 [Podospora didyma]